MITIITVCKNSAATIQRTIDSVLGQTLKEFEYIIVDGKSSDATTEILASAEAAFDGRLRWISQEDRGVYDAMNKAIAMARGSLVGIINSDDWYERDALAIADVVHATGGEEIIHGLVRIHREGRPFMIRGSSEQFLPVTMIEHPTCFVPRSVYKRHGVFDSSLRMAADYDFMLRCWKAGVPFRWVEKILANFSSGGVSDVSYLRSLRERALVLRHHGYLSALQFRREQMKINLKIMTAGFSS
ncbi:MAG: glycosyltransferase family 2 protein [Ignavibacteriales bacterium]|nr:glycosyltransferase family 2 protein [Ignavibacteriales bacterium]